MASLYDPRASSTYGQINNTNNGSSTTQTPWWQAPKVAPKPEDKIEGFQLPNLEGVVQGQRNAGQGMLSAQDTRQGDWLSRYSGALGNQEKMRAMYSRLGDEVGLSGLQRNANQLGAQLEAIPQTYGAATRGFDVNANQLQRITGTKTAQLAPIAQKAQTQAQQAQDYVNTQMGLAQAEQQKELMPFTYEKDFLTDRIARETSMFTQDNQNELSALTSKMNAGITLTEAEKERQQALKMQENNFKQQKAMAELQFGYDKQLATMKGGSSANDPLGLGY